MAPIFKFEFEYFNRSRATVALPHILEIIFEVREICSMSVKKRCFHAGHRRLRCRAKVERPRGATRQVSEAYPTREPPGLRSKAELQEKGPQNSGERTGHRLRQITKSRDARHVPTATNEAHGALGVGADGSNWPQSIAQQQQIPGHIPLTARSSLTPILHRQPRIVSTEFRKSDGRNPNLQKASVDDHARSSCRIQQELPMQLR